MLSRRSLFAVGGAALLLNGCAQVAPGGTPPLMDVIGADPDLSSFRSAVPALLRNCLTAQASTPYSRQPTLPGLARLSVSAAVNMMRCSASSLVVGCACRIFRRVADASGC